MLKNQLAERGYIEEGGETPTPKTFLNIYSLQRAPLFRFLCSPPSFFSRSSQTSLCVSYCLHTIASIYLSIYLDKAKLWALRFEEVSSLPLMHSCNPQFFLFMGFLFSFSPLLFSVPASFPFSFFSLLSLYISLSHLLLFVI